VLYGLEFS